MQRIGHYPFSISSMSFDDAQYKEKLQAKKQYMQGRLAQLLLSLRPTGHGTTDTDVLPELEVVPSPPLHCRQKCRFAVGLDDRVSSSGQASLTHLLWDHGGPTVLVEAFPVAALPIYRAMPVLMQLLQPAGAAGAADAGAAGAAGAAVGAAVGAGYEEDAHARSGLGSGLELGVDLSLLGRGLTSVNYLSTLSQELVITLIYNAEMPAQWGAAAALLREELLRALTLSPVPASAPVPSPGVPAASLRQLSVIGRSRGSKQVVGRDWVLEELPKPIPPPVPLPPALQEPEPAATGVTPADAVAHASAAGVLRYRQVDDGFSNPNSVVNLRALAWLCSVAGQITEGAGAGAGAEADAGGVDLLEMYCGNGNHTVALAGERCLPF
jgi:hypothetical protein